MDRHQEIKVAELLNLAIWIRDNVDSMELDEIKKQVGLMADYEILSSRQMSAIVNNRISHSMISKMIDKGSKTGGNLNVGTLEILRNVLYSRANGETDYKLIKQAIGQGTSQGMISKLTGVSQSSISRRRNG